MTIDDEAMFASLEYRSCTDVSWLPVVVAFPVDITNRRDGAAMQAKEFNHIGLEESIRWSRSARKKIVWVEATGVLEKVQRIHAILVGYLHAHFRMWANHRFADDLTLITTILSLLVLVERTLGSIRTPVSPARSPGPLTA